MARPKGRGRGRGSRGRGTGTGRPRGRPRKLVIDSDEEHEQEQMDVSDHDEKPVETTVEEEENSAPDETEESTTAPEQNKDNSVEFNIDDDISQLVPPTFSTISKGPPQPMLELSWDHQYSPMGEKVAKPNIHMCIACKLPIRLYGRLIPCKHVFCYACAEKQGDRCSCCEDRVTRIEKAPLGSVFMCLHGGIQYGYEGCRRTYLSQRDLQAHFNHRHKPRTSSGGGGGGGSSINDVQSPIHSSSSTPSHRQNIPVHYSSGGRSNLISVPLQATSAATATRTTTKDTHADNRFDRKTNTSYSRNNPTSGWGSFRPY